MVLDKHFGLNPTIIWFLLGLAVSCTPPAPNEQKGMNLGVRYEIRSRRPVRITDAKMIGAASEWGGIAASQLQESLIARLKQDSSKASCRPDFDSLANQTLKNQGINVFRYAFWKLATPQPTNLWTATEMQILQAYSSAYIQKAALQANIQRNKTKLDEFIYTVPIQINNIVCQKCHNPEQSAVYLLRLPQPQVVNYILDSGK